MPERTKRLLIQLADGVKNWLAGPPHPRPRRLDVMFLDDRILYSATAMPLPDASAVDMASLDMEAIEAALQEAIQDSFNGALDSAAFQAASPSQTSPDTDTAADASSDPSSVATSIDTQFEQLDDLLHATNDDQFARTVVVVDSGLSDLQTLLDEFAQSNFDVIFINAQSDGISQITQALSNYEAGSISSLHIVSHGADGLVQLGSSWLTANNVAQYQDAFAQWGIQFTDDADILIYGCNVASSAANGADEFLQSIATFTGADVAASNDLTGYAELGGDWELEYQVGEITSTAIVSEHAQSSWQHTLATITVTTTSDENNGTTTSITALQSTPGGSGISLREAIIAANNTAGSDTIILGSGTYTLSIAGDGENSAAQGDLDITSNITITGNGTTLTIINATSMADRVFEVTAAGSLTLNSLEVTGGSGGTYAGGAVNNSGSFAATNVVFDANIVGNTDGGAIYSAGTTSLSRVTIINSSANAGGAINIVGGTTTIVNTTISGNTSTYDGAGIRITAGTASVTYTSIGDNTSSSGYGGGIFRSGGTLTIGSSLVADNTSQFGGQDVQGAITSAGYNVIENHSGFTLAGNDTSTALNMPTLTYDAESGHSVYVISSGGLAQGGGNPTGAPTTDIRGVTRDSAPDIGSYELNSAPVLDATKSPTLTTQAEDSGAPAGAVGTLISSLVDFATPTGQVDNVTDSSNALLGIAVTAADTTNGTWWYSTDGGTNWAALGTVTATSARLLAADANTRIYFQSNANYNGTLSSAITFRAWDRNSGTNGSTANTSTNGGTTSFSTATDTASLVISAVNDAPVNTLPTSWTVTEDASLTLSGISISDVDGGSGTFTTTLRVGAGTLTATTAGGVTVSGSGTRTLTLTGTIANLNAFLAGASTPTFTPEADSNGAVQLEVVTSDGGNTGSGGTMSDTDTRNIFITAAADAVNDSTSTNEDSAVTITVFSNDSFTNAGKTVTSVNGTAIMAGGAAVVVTGGQVTLNVSGQLIFTPDANYNGAPTFTYTTQTFATGALAYQFFDGTPTSLTVDNIATSGGTTGVDANFDVTGISAALTGSSDTFAMRYTGIIKITTAGTYTFYVGSDDGSALYIDGVKVVNNDGDHSFFETSASAALTAGDHTIEIRFYENSGGETLTASYSGPDTGATKTALSQSNAIGRYVTEIATVTVTVNAVNDAPVLDAAKSPVMNTITETSNSVPSGAVGTLVSALIDFATPSGQVDNVTDVDGTSTIGIAVTNADERYGNWWYSTDNGTNWQRLGNATATSARLLAADANTRVYFQINSATETWGSVGNVLSIRAWDMSSGTNGGTANVTTNGGTTAFSSTLDTVDISVTGVADAARFLGPELITNGTFNTNLSGWTTSGTATFSSNAIAFGGSNAVGPHSASQTIATVAGRTYELSFSYRDDSSTRNQSLQVTANGTANVLTTPQITTSLSGSSYVTYYYTFVADSSSTTITFTDTSDTSGQTLSGTTSSDGYVDNISVRQRDGDFGTLTYTENAGAQSIFSSFTLSDVDSSNLTNATIQFTNGYLASEDLLSFSNQLGITGSWNSTNGTLTLSGSSSVANYQTAIQSITYTNSSDSPGSSKTITFTVNDGSATSVATTRSVSITAVNDEQVIALNTGTTVAENSAGTVLTSSMLSTTDADNSASQLTYTITSATSNGTLRRSGIALSLSSTFTQADINNGLITYDHSGAELFTESFSFSVDDGAGTSSSGTFNLTITPVNDNAVTITSNGAGNSASISLNETLTRVTTVTVSDADLPGDTFTYSIIGGLDASRFQINSAGVLTFIAAPDFEAPTDSNSDNVYHVNVQVSDGVYTDTQAIAVTILNVQSTTLAVTTTADTNDSGLGSSFNIEQLYAVGGGADGKISLREAIIAANNTLGTDTITFEMLNNEAGYSGTAGVDAFWRITLSSALPTITESVILNGLSQTTFGGNINPGTLGTASSVGTGTDTIGTVERPEIAIVGAAGFAGITVSANNVTIQGFAMYGFSTVSAVLLNDGYTNTLIQYNVFGSGPTAIADPGAALNNMQNVQALGADNGILRNNIIAYAQSTGFYGSLGTNNWQILNNHFIDNGLNFSNGDAIALNATNGATIDGNIITGTSTQAIILSGSTTNVVISDNTITGNGVGPATGAHSQYDAIAMRSGTSAVTISCNIIANNYGAGITVNSGASGIEITQNSIYGNGTIVSRQGGAASGAVGIDLQSSTDNVNFGTAPFYTVNDTGDGDSGGNSLQNYPVLTAANSNGSQLTITGTFNSLANRTYRVEFFSANTTYANGIGQGATYLGAATVTTDGSGNAVINSTLNLHVDADQLITATVTDLTTHETSEFAAQLAVNGPVIGHDDDGYLEFDGVDDQVTIANSASLTMTNTMTMEAWFRADPSANINQIILNKEGEYELAIHPDGSLQWAFANSNPGWAWHNTGFIVSTGTWTHVAVTYDYGVVTTYVNGEVVEVFNGSGSIGDAHTGLNDLLIGGRLSSPTGKYFDGGIDEVRIWNIARTQLEINDALRNPPTGSATGLVASYSFSGTGSTVTDLSGNGNHGTLGGGVATNQPTRVGLSTNEDSLLTISAANGLLANDIDLDSDSKTVSHVNGSSAAIGAAFVLPSGATLTLQSNGSYTYDGSTAFASLAAGQSTFDSFTYTVTAGHGNSDTATVSIQIVGQNDAPVLDNSGSMALTTLTEDQTNNSGNTIASIISSAGGDRITDADSGAIEGIAITALASGNGTWEYSVDGAATWIAIGSVSDSSVLLLRSSDLIRFVPNAQNATAGNFTFRAWDRTSGSAGTKVDASANGGTTAFSSASEVASIVVTAVNDAPTITNAAVVTLTSTNEDAPSSSTAVATLLTSASWADVDTGAVKGIAITGLTGNSNWQFSSDNGTTWTNISAVSTANALLLDSSALVRYSPDGQNGETATLTFAAWDKTTGTASTNATPSFANASTTGGTTAFSSQSASAVITVSSVNDSAIAVADYANADEAGGVSNGTAGVNPSGNVLANDTDVDVGDSMNVIGVAAGVVSSAAGNVASPISGTYGFIQIDSAGNYTYTVDNNNAVVQALRTSGQTVLDTFTYTIQDAGGAFSSTQIVITVRGTNDAPTAAIDNVNAVEAGGTANGTAGTNPTGNVLANDIDVDGTDSKTVLGVAAGLQSSASGNVGSSVSGSYGALTILANGNYTYVVNNNSAAVQALRTAGDTLTDVFTYTMTDTAGATSTTQVTVTIHGANDAPTATNDSATAIEAGGVANASTGSNGSGNVLTNDTDIDSGDSKLVSGVVAGAAVSASGSVGSTVAGQYGTVTINSDGSYNYIVDNNNAAVQALRTSAQTLSEIFTYTMQDTGGLTSTATLTITIQGANDSPVAVGNTATAEEAGGIANAISGTDPTGNVLTNDTDVDSGDTKTVTGVAAGTPPTASGNVGATVAGNYGSIVINANGTYAYTVNNSNATVEALHVGQSLTDTFTYTIVDTAGATSTATIIITIDGADDLPFAVVDQNTSDEAGGANNTTPGTNPTGNVFTNDTTPNGNTLVGVAAGVLGSASGNVNSAVTGLYGSLIIDAGGNYLYTLNNSLSVVEALRVSGDHLTDIFTYTFQDSLGYTASTQVTITIDGSNDNPGSVNDLAIAIEAGGVSNNSAGANATGDVLANDVDVDANDTKQVIGVVFGAVSSASGSVGASVAGNYGSVVLNANGTFSYAVNNSLAAVQALRTSSDTLTELFTYTMEDTAGAHSTATLTITIQGQNDNPVAVVDNITAIEAGGANNSSAGTNPTGNVLTNDTDVDSGDTKTITGVASGVQSSTVGNVGSTVTGSYGSIQINSNGTFSYTVNNANATVQALRTSGQSLQDVFTYTVTDTAGATSSTQVTVTIQGSNDAPIVTSDSATATEAGGIANATAGTNPTGNVLSNDSDVDAGDSSAISGVSAGVHASAVGSVGSAVAGAYGSIQINSNGTYSYTVDNNNAAVQALRLTTDTITDIFTYTVQDASGATSSTQITITIEGKNDTPVGISDNDDAYEAGAQFNATLGSTASGNLIANDIEFDSGDTMTVSGAASGIQSSTSGNVGAAVSGNFGSIVINSDGSYTYTIDDTNATVQALRLSTQSLTDVFSYTIVDLAGAESTAQITITLHGANDAPVAVIDAGTATEAGGLLNGTAGANATGNVLSNDTDVDAGDAKTVAGVAAGSSGSPTNNVGASVAGSFGTVTISANGSYTYIVDNTNAAVQALRNTSQTLQDIFTYRVIDNAGLESFTQLTITIEGANDTPTAISDNTGVAVESGGLANGTAGSNAIGNVLNNDTDVDSQANGETKTVVGVAAGTASSASGSVNSTVTGVYGSIEIASDGSYVYTVNETNAAVQALRTSANSLTDVFTYTMMDASGAASTTQVTITIQGSNDTPTAIADATAIAIESGGLANSTAGSNGTGNVLTNDTDVDSAANGETKTVSGVASGVQSSTTGNVGSSVSGNYGSIAIAADGSYTYVINESNASVQALRTSGQTLMDVFSYTMVDAGGLASTTQVTITLQGANDTPTAIADNTAVAIEAGGIANSSAGSNGTGNVLTNDTDVDSTANGETKTVIGVTSGVQSSASGNVGTSVLGSYGSLVLASDGSYTYAVNNSNATVQSLRTSADTLSDIFTYTMIDAGGLTSTTQVTIVIQGANDAPIAANDNFSAIEAGGVNNATAGTNGTGNVLTNDIDVDASDSKTVTGVVAGGQSTASGNVGANIIGTYGTIAIQSDGSFIYVVDDTNSNVQALRSVTDTLTDTFTYAMVDAAGLSSIATITLTITGRNDAPVASNDTATAIEAGGVANGTPGANGTGNVLTNDSDVDSVANGETKTVFGVAAGMQASASGNVGTSVAGSFGSITIASNGSYTYTVNNNNATVQALRTVSDQLTDRFTYTMTDAAGLTSTATLTVTITGQNDAPTNLSAPALSVNENASNGTSIGSVTPTDIDSGDTFTYQLTNSAGGRFAIDANTGLITVADGTLIDRELAASHSITVRVTDAGGLTYSRSFTISLNDIDEFNTGAVTDSNASANSVVENAINGTTVGITAIATDADATTNTMTYSLDDNAGGRFTINGSTGVVTVANSSLLDYEVAQTHNITIRATSADSSFSTMIFTISLTDANESPVSAISDTDAAAEYVIENAANGALVGVTAFASDPDGTASVTYSLDNNASGRFAIDAVTGAVSVAGAIDREVAASYTIIVRATSTDASFTTRSFTILIGDADEFNVGAINDNDALANQVTENATIGTVVGISAFAADADATNNAISYSLFNDDGGRFAINSTTGIVTVNGPLDRETDGNLRTITVRATSADGSTTDQNFTIQLVDADEYDTSTPTDSDASTNEVSENVAIGTVVGITANAFDLDATNNSIQYSLTSNPSGLFQIDATTGIVTTAAAIDRETIGAMRTITVQALSSDGSTSTQNFNISIIDLDEYDTSSPIDSDVATDQVDENVTIGTLVGITANAFDLDATNNAITYSLTNNPDGLFAIDALTGVVTTASAIDRELHGSVRSITVQAQSSDGSTATHSFNIAINDLNEASVSTPTDSDTATNAVDENVAIGTTVGVTASAFDLDSTNNTITYSLTSNPDNLFKIDINTGVITTAAAIDRESHGASRTIVVRASSTDGSTADQSFTISINDLDEFDTSPIIDNDPAPNTLNENAANGTVVGITALASDADATTNAITYTLDNNAGGRFSIDATTGIVTVADGSLLDYETSTFHTIVVRAQSADGSFSTHSFTINLTDINENAVSAINDADADANFVLENSAPSATVGVTAFASDSDGTDSVTYSLDNDAGGRFAIDSTTGLITVAGAIDREAAPSYIVIVRATSTDSSSTTRSFTILIGDIDEADTTAISDSDAIANTVVENASIGTQAGITAAASDADATTDTITYSLTDNDGGRFAIDPVTGIVTVAGAIDREVDTATRSITIRATSADSSFTEQTFAINIEDSDEFNVSTPTDSDGAANTVDENAAIGTSVGITANAFDSDSTTNAITYYLSSNPDGLFQIDANTGVVTTAALINRELHGASRTITIEAHSTDGSTSSQTFTVTINDLNEFTVSAPTDADATANILDENAAIGTAVGITAKAFDLDSTTNAIIYSLNSNPDNLFQIDPSTGVVTTAAAINRELHGALRSITIQAQSADGSTATQTFTIAINDLNEFAVTAPTDINAAANQVDENSAIGTAVGITADAFDLDSTTNVVTYSLTSNPDGLFQIDANTGVVTTAAIINRELHGGSRTLTIEARSSDGLTSSQIFTVAINDLNEFSVTTPVDSNPSINQVDENAAIGSAVGIAASALDLDSTTNAITYSLISNPGNLFQIDPITGVVTTASTINRELHGALRSITIQAQSADGSTSTQTFNITINDLNEFTVSAPLDSSASINQISENVAIGTAVGIVAQAADNDATTNSITYSLSNSSGGRFQIDSNSGVVTTAAAINFESASSHSITVQATSSDGSIASTTFVIAVINVNEAPKANADRFTTTYADVLHVASGGLLANDIDPENDTLTATLISGPNSGSLTLLPNGSIVYTPVIPFVGEVTFQYTVTDGLLTSTIQTVTITVTQPNVPSPSSNSGSNNASGDATTNNANGTGNATSEENANAPANIVAPAVGADTQSSDSQATDDAVESKAESHAGHNSSSHRTGALILDANTEGFAFMTTTESSSLLSNVSLTALNHHSVAHLNAEQSARLTQELAHTHSTLERLEDHLQTINETPPMEGVELIAKTAIGSGVVVWVIHISQVMAALLAASSAWMHVDPLSILNASKDLVDSKTTDAAESLFDGTGMRK